MAKTITWYEERIASLESALAAERERADSNVAEFDRVRNAANGLVSVGAAAMEQIMALESARDAALAAERERAEKAEQWCKDARPVLIDHDEQIKWKRKAEFERDAALDRAEKAEAVLGDLTTKIDKHCEWCKERPDKIEFYCPLDAANAELPELLAAARADAVRGFAEWSRAQHPVQQFVLLNPDGTPSGDSIVDVAEVYLAVKEPRHG